jgi:hypothetical protein
MMNIGTATKLFDFYTGLLEAKKAVLMELRKRAKTDSKIAELAKAETEQFLDCVREILIFSILFDRRLQKQADLVVMHPGPLADLMFAKHRFTAKRNEMAKFWEELEKEQVCSSSPAGSAAPDRADS